MQYYNICICMCRYVCMCAYVNMYMYIYIYIYREREREREIYIHIHIWFQDNSSNSKMDSINPVVQSVSRVLCQNHVYSNHVFRWPDYIYIYIYVQICYVLSSLNIYYIVFYLISFLWLRVHICLLRPCSIYVYLCIYIYIYIYIYRERERENITI